MTTTYTKTDNYGLNLYGDNDPADLRDGYNRSMRTIDTTLKQHLDKTTSVKQTAEAAKSKADNNGGILNALGATDAGTAGAAKTKWDKASSDASYAKSKADNNGGILNALGATDAGTAGAAKTKWDKASSDASYAKSKADNNGSAINNITSSYATNTYVNNTFLKHVNIAVAKLSNKNFVIEENSTTPVDIIFDTHDGTSSFDDESRMIVLSSNRSYVTVTQDGFYLISAEARFGNMGVASGGSFRGLELYTYVNNEIRETAYGSISVGGDGSTNGAAQNIALPVRPFKLRANDKISLKYKLNAATKRTSGKIILIALSVIRISK